MQQQDLIAGDTLNFETDVPDYPPSAGWAAKVRLVPEFAGGTAVTIAASTSATADRYAFQVGPVVTAAWLAGSYSWSIWVEKAGERYTRQQGRLVVKPDPSAVAAGTDARSQAERSLDSINALLENRASDAQLRYRINGRELERYPLQDLLRLKQHFETAVANERRAAGLADPRGTVRRILCRVR